MQRKDNVSLLKQLISESLLRENVTEFDERPTSADVIALFGPKPRTEPAAEA